MAGRYIKWSDVVNRYRRMADLGGAELMDDTYIRYAEADIEGKLAGYFTVPFSSNNLTAKDLMIDAAYIRAKGFKNPEEAEEIRKSLEEKIKDLQSGKAAMVTTSGDALYSSGQGTIWGEHMNYHSYFGLLPPEDQLIDPDQIDDEYSDRDT